MVLTIDKICPISLKNEVSFFEILYFRTMQALVRSVYFYQLHGAEE
jgi:hypothetical protein